MTEFTYQFKGKLPKVCPNLVLEEIIFPEAVNGANEKALIDAIVWSVSKFNENGDRSVTLKLVSPLLVDNSPWIPYFQMRVRCSL